MLLSRSATKVTGNVFFRELAIKLRGSRCETSHTARFFPCRHSNAIVDCALAHHLIGHSILQRGGEHATSSQEFRLRGRADIDGDLEPHDLAVAPAGGNAQPSMCLYAFCDVLEREQFKVRQPSPPASGVGQLIGPARASGPIGASGEALFFALHIPRPWTLGSHTASVMHFRSHWIAGCQAARVLLGPPALCAKTSISNSL
jgi:hypothetical protein